MTQEDTRAAAWGILNMYRPDPRGSWVCEPSEPWYDGIRAAGRDGWQLVSVLNEAGDGATYPFINFYFIRPLTAEQAAAQIEADAAAAAAGTDTDDEATLSREEPEDAGGNPSDPDPETVPASGHF